MASNSRVVRLSDAQTRYLIDLYRSHEVLWNCHSKDYKSQQDRRKALQSIQMRFKATFGVKLEVNVLRTKLNSFRNSFSKELGLVMQARGSGAAGTDDTYVSKYPYFHELAFLQQVMKKKGSSATNLDDALSLSQNSSHSLDDEQTQHQFLIGSVAEPEGIVIIKREGEEEVSETSASTFSSSPPTPSTHLHTCQEGDPPAQRSVLTTTITAVGPPEQDLRGGSARKARKRKLDQESEVMKSINCFIRRRMWQDDLMADPLSRWAQFMADNLRKMKDEKKRELLRLTMTSMVIEALKEELSG